MSRYYFFLNFIEIKQNFIIKTREKSKIFLFSSNFRRYFKKSQDFDDSTTVCIYSFTGRCTGCVLYALKLSRFSNSQTSAKSKLLSLFNTSAPHSTDKSPSIFPRIDKKLFLILSRFFSPSSLSL